MSPARLLTTKLNIPRSRPNLVERQHLLEKMDGGLQAGSRLTLICAPAGYGKTTLVTTWVQNKQNIAWLSLNADESQPVRFLTYITAAFQTIDASIGEGVQSILEMPQQPALEDMVTELVNNLAKSSQNIVLILDDYHAIKSARVHDVLDFLVEHTPQNLHLIITTREDPPLPLARLRARGQLTEIRAHDLRFSRQEISTFCLQAMHLTASDALLEHLERLTEGWISGLQMAGLAVQGQKDINSLLESFDGSHRYIIDYLMDEVLSLQPVEIRTFLQRTSILERFNAGLCAAVTGMPEVVCAAMLDDLERKNLFLVALDPTGHWYRYHHLFGDILRTSLSAEAEREIHHLAAVWFDNSTLTSEALPHYLAAGEVEQAASMVDKAALQVLYQGEMRTLLEWCASFPEQIILRQKNLAICMAAANLFSGEAGKAAAALSQLKTAKQDVSSSGRYLTLAALMKLYSGQTASLLEEAQIALKALPADEVFFRAIALQVLATAYQWEGNYTRSSSAYEQAYHLGREMKNAFASLTALANLVYNLIDMGQLVYAEKLCLHAISQYVDHRNRPLPILSLVYNPLCTIRFEQNQLDEAEEYGRLALSLSHKMYSSKMTGGDAETKLVEIAFARGDIAAGLEMISSIRQFAHREKITFIANKMDFLELSFLLRQGDAANAKRIIESMQSEMHTPLAAARHIFLLYKLRYLLLIKHPQEALAESDDLLNEFRLSNVNGKLIVLLLLRVKIHQALKDDVLAQSDLKEALMLAAPQGYLWQFVRMGATIAPLLKQNRQIAPEFIDSILEKLPGKQDFGTTAGPTGMPEPLSEQEIRITRMMSAGMSNQQIASELFISVGTVKWHVHNILGKLNTTSRTQAAARARELELIV